MEKTIKIKIEMVIDWIRIKEYLDMDKRKCETNGLFVNQYKGKVL